MIKINIDAGSCSGCRTCEAVCSLWHEDMVNPLLARLNILKHEEIGEDIPVLCLQCTAAPCAEACPQEAIEFKKQTGTWIVNEAECIGCGLCVDACNSFMIRMHPRKNTAFKCDHCGGDPQCVKHCQLKALTIEIMK